MTFDAGPAVSAETARAALADATDGELSLALDDIYRPAESPWMVSAYRFDMRAGGTKAGTISLRVGHDERLVRYAGHVGYAVEPAWRGRGFATRAVRLLLPLARVHRLDPLWTSCNPDNLASCVTLERLGATYVETVALPPHYDRYWSRGEREKRRYRLDLGPGR